MRLPSKPHSRIPVSTAMCGERCRGNNSVRQAAVHLHDRYAVMAAKVDGPPCKLLPLRARDRPDRRSCIKQTCGRCGCGQGRAAHGERRTDCTPQSVRIDWSQHICARSHCAALSEFSGPSERAARTVIRQPGRGIAVCRALHRRCAHRQVIRPLQPLTTLGTRLPYRVRPLPTAVGCVASRSDTTANGQQVVAYSEYSAPYLCTGHRRGDDGDCRELALLAVAECVQRKPLRREVGRGTRVPDLNF